MVSEPTKWVVLHTVGDGSMRSRQVIINVDQLLFIAEPLKLRGGEAGTKLTFPGGVVLAVQESPTLIRAFMDGTAESDYEEAADETKSVR